MLTMIEIHWLALLGIVIIMFLVAANASENYAALKYYVKLYMQVRDELFRLQRQIEEHDDST